eukprot:2578721-Pyramimonas_sp.AAC.1
MANCISKARAYQANIKHAKKAAVDKSSLVRSAEHPVLGTISTVYANGKSYCLTVGKDSKTTLFVEISGKKCAEHAALLSELITVSCKKSFTKAQAVAWRDRKYATAA